MWAQHWTLTRAFLWGHFWFKTACEGIKLRQKVVVLLEWKKRDWNDRKLRKKSWRGRRHKWKLQTLHIKLSQVPAWFQEGQEKYFRSWWWDGWMASLTQWTWVWVDFGSWWWIGRPGVLWFMGLQRVRHGWATELNWTELLLERQGLAFKSHQLGKQTECLKLRIEIPEEPQSWKTVS